MNRSMVFIQQVALKADDFYPLGEQLGHWAQRAFGRRRRAQITNLEQIANSAVKVADVLNFVKKQTGKARPNETWKATENGNEGFGAALLRVFREQVDPRCDEVLAFVAQQTNQPTGDDDRQRTRLALIRELIAQLAAQYEMEAAHDDTT